MATEKEQLVATAILKDQYTPIAGRIAKATQGITQQIKRLNMMPMKIMSLVGFAGVTATAYKATRGVLAATLELENYDARLKTVAADADEASKLMTWAMEFAKTTPYQLNEVIDGMVRLKAYGIDPLGGALQTIGDFSASMGRSLLQGVEAVADAMMGEWERMKEFGVKRVMVEQFIREHGMAQAFDKTGKVIDEAAAKAALFALMTERSAGGMSRMMDTIGGKWSNLKDALWRIAVSIGESLKKPLKDAIDLLITYFGRIEKWVRDNKDTIAKAFTDFFKGAVRWAVRLVEATRLFIDIAGDKVKRVAGVFDTLRQNFQKILKIALVFISAWAGFKIAKLIFELYKLAKAIAEIGIAGAIASALAGNWKQVLLGAVVAVGTYFGLRHMIDKMFKVPGETGEEAGIDTTRIDETMDKLFGKFEEVDEKLNKLDTTNETLGKIESNTRQMIKGFNIMGGGLRTERATAFEIFRQRTAPRPPATAQVAQMQLTPSGTYAVYPTVNISVTGGPLDHYIGQLVKSGIEQFANQLGSALRGSPNV